MGVGDSNKTVSQKAQQATDSIASATEALNEFGNAASKNGVTLSVVEKSFINSTKSISNFARSMGDLGSTATLGLDFGLISNSANLMAGGFDFVTGALDSTLKAFELGVQTTDAFTGSTRDMNARMYETAASFNLGYAAAKKYSEYLFKTGKEYSTQEFGYISPEKRIEAFESLAKSGIPLERLNDTISSTAGELDLLSASFLQAQALSMDFGAYSDKLSNLMIKQGLSAQAATEAMAMIGQTSQNTGLSVDLVADNLMRLSNQYSKLGLTVSFGQPILESFTNSLKDMGYGIENATDLASTFNESILSLSSNYAAAYVTMQRGGLDMGAGQGALGASIGLRAKLSPTNKDTDQKQLALDLAGAMKDTIASLTGGDIVTVQEAASNQSLQTAFVAQTNLLKQLYNISDTSSQDRTLEMLDQLGKAQSKGDVEAVDALAANLKDVVTARNDTLSNEEKINASLGGYVSSLNDVNQNLIELIKTFSGDLLDKGLQQADKQYDGLESSMTDFNKFNVEEVNEQLLSSVESKISMVFDAVDDVRELTSNTLESIGSLFEDGQMSTNDVVAQGYLKDLVGTISKLTQQLDLLLNKQASTLLRSQ